MSKTVVVFGSVKSSNVVLEALINADVEVKKVFSLDEKYSAGVSGYYPIHETARKHGIPYCTFRKINDSNILDELNSINPNYIFVVGLSQLISKDILESATEGVIGLHPAPLPKYRGRAAMVWQMLLGETQSAVTLFFIDEGMDSGDIIVQEPFSIESTDYAIDVDAKGLQALEKGIVRVARMISDGSVTRTKQDESKASYLLKRTPEDGEINWDDSIINIHRLIRAVSKPYPGAFSYYDGQYKVIIWRADILQNTKYIGINGQICDITEDTFDIVCKDGLLHVVEYEIEESTSDNRLQKMYVGHKFKRKNR